MGGRQPKNATWFELSVAASLKANLYSIGEKSLNLTDYYIDVNPPAYASDLTHVGYPVSIDIIAEKGDSRYNISCKFSEKEDEVLSIQSQAFQDVFLEFVPVLKVEPLLRYHMGFALATNMRLSRSVGDFFKHPSLNESRKLSDRVKKHGKGKYKSRFNDSLFDEETLLQLVQRTAILRFSIGELESLHEKNEAFQQAFESISKSLVRTPKVGFNLIGVRPCDIIFNCHSQTHKRCTEVVIDDLFCHFGDLKTISKRLREQVTHLDRTIIALVPSLMLPLLNEKNLVLSDNISKFKAYSLLTKAFNNHRLLGFPEYVGFFVVPGTWDLVIFDSKSLASELKNTQDAYFRYHPDKVRDLHKLGLGPEALKEITKWAFLLGFKLKIDESDIAISERD